MPKEKTPGLEKILSSSGRIKILTVLSRVEELHLTEIAKRTEQSYSSTERHLGNLAKASVVEEKNYGRIRMFKLRLDNPRVKLLRDLIIQWNHGEEEEEGRTQA